MAWENASEKHVRTVCTFLSYLYIYVPTYSKTHNNNTQRSAMCPVKCLCTCCFIVYVRVSAVSVLKSIRVGASYGKRRMDSFRACKLTIEWCWCGISSSTDMPTDSMEFSSSTIRSGGNWPIQSILYSAGFIVVCMKVWRRDSVALGICETFKQQVNKRALKLCLQVIR